MKLKNDEVLVPGNDHSYRVAQIRTAKATWNPAAREWFEYVGDEYLEDGEIVVEVSVVD